MKKSILVSFCGITTAVSVVLLYLGSVAWIFAYIVPIVSGLLIELSHKTFGVKTALLIYFSVSLLSILSLPDKECALLYTMFFGYYPMLKVHIDKIKVRFVSLLLKLVVFNFAVVIAETICVYVLLIPLDNSFGKWGIIVLMLLANVVFLLYEKLFSLFNVLWEKKYKRIFNNIIKY